MHFLELIEYFNHENIILIGCRSMPKWNQKIGFDPKCRVHFSKDECVPIMHWSIYDWHKFRRSRSNQRALQNEGFWSSTGAWDRPEKVNTGAVPFLLQNSRVSSSILHTSHILIQPIQWPLLIWFSSYDLSCDDFQPIILYVSMSTYVYIVHVKNQDDRTGIHLNIVYLSEEKWTVSSNH